jgi:hypothetical protein
MTPETITPEAKAEIQAFQQFLKVLFIDYANVGDMRVYKQMKNALKPFSKYTWYKDTGEQISRQNQHLAKTVQDKRVVKKITPQEIKKINQTALTAFRSGDMSQVRKAGKILDEYTPAFVRSLNRDSDIKNIVRNPVKKTVRLFGSGYSNELVPHFGAGDAEKLISLDLEQFRYSPVPFPSGTRDVEEVIFFMQNLKDTDEDIEINGESAIRLLRMSTSKELMEEFGKQLKKYLQGWDQKALAFVVKTVNEVPLLRQLNNKAKADLAGIKLYRGVGVDEDVKDIYDGDDVAAQDLSKKTIAVSSSYQAALNFAYKRGHMMGNVSNTERSFMLTYTPTPKDIVLVLEIFGSVYGESEIIIRPTKKNLSKVDDVTKYEDDYDEERW